MHLLRQEPLGMQRSKCLHDERWRTSVFWSCWSCTVHIVVQEALAASCLCSAASTQVFHQHLDKHPKNTPVLHFLSPCGYILSSSCCLSGEKRVLKLGLENEKTITATLVEGCSFQPAVLKAPLLMSPVGSKDRSAPDALGGWVECSPSVYTQVCVHLSSELTKHSVLLSDC